MQITGPIRRPLAGLAAGLALVLSAGHAPALEVQRLDVDKRGGEFFVDAQSIVEAPADFVYSVLIDYENFHRLSSSITDTRWLPAEDGSGRLGYTRIDSCVWFFCRAIERVEKVAFYANRTIETNAIPERSDFKSYRTRWTLDGLSESTRVRFEAEMRPSFWLPPVIGAWALRKKLEHSAALIGERIEYLYRNDLTLTDLPAHRTAADEPADANHSADH